MRRIERDMMWNMAVQCQMHLTEVMKALYPHGAPSEPDLEAANAALTKASVAMEEMCGRRATYWPKP